MQKLNFLVVDDASFIRDLVKRTLKGQLGQCQIDEAVNGKKGQTLLGKHSYDLVLCDWEMPEMSGLELLTWLRGYEQENDQAKTPFIMVTSRGEKEHVVKAVQAGVSDYIGKPFSSDQLMKKVIKLLSVNHKELVRSLLKGGSSAQPSNPFGGGDSASLLTAKPAAAKKAASAAPQGSASLLTAGSVSSQLVDKAPGKKAASNKTSLAKITLRSPSANWQGDLRDINLTDASIVFDFGDGKPPAVLEQVVIDVTTKKWPDRIARINTFVTAIVLQEKTLHCQKVLVSLRVADDDPEKMEILSHFVAEVR